MAILFLLGSFLTGMGLVKRLFPFTNAAERIFWGATLGIMSSTWAAYLISRVLSDLKYSAMLALTLVIGGLAAVFIYKDFIPVRRPKALGNWYGEHRGLLWLLALFAPIFFYFFYVGMFHPKAGLLFLTLTSWYDLALHLAFANSFVHGHNFPPAYLLLPAEPMRYPFLADFHAAILLRLGWGMWPSFGVTSFVMAIAFVGIFYCWARRLTDSQPASVMATLLFFFNGGLGFLLFLRDWRQSPESLWANICNLKENYTDIWSESLKWANTITSGIIPQRAMLYGMPIAFIVLTLIGMTWRRWSEGTASETQDRATVSLDSAPAFADSGAARRDDSRWDGVQLLVPAGVITGLLPLFHVHSYVALGFISCVLFAIRPRLVWLAFWAPAILLAIPSLIDIASHLSSGERAARFHLGWISNPGPHFWLFLIRNFGLPLFLIIPAFCGRIPRYLRTFYLPFAALLVLCFFFVISQNELDNLKLMYYGYSVTVVIISVWVCQIARRPMLRPLVVLIILCSTASGALAVLREAKLIHAIFAPEEIEAGEFARINLAPKALFLTGQYHNQPVLCLAGKPIVLGFDFWVTSHGYKRAQYDAIKKDVAVMYRGGPESEKLLKKYGINYVYLGPKEKADLHPNAPYFDTHHAVVFKNNSIAIYDATH